VFTATPAPVPDPGVDTVPVSEDVSGIVVVDVTATDERLLLISASVGVGNAVNGTVGGLVAIFASMAATAVSATGKLEIDERAAGVEVTLLGDRVGGVTGAIEVTEGAFVGFVSAVTIEARVAGKLEVDEGVIEIASEATIGEGAAREFKDEDGIIAEVSKAVLVVEGIEVVETRS
jgi:CxxC motif-containing protein (DUF1111 family)